jgi:hypothetical protein
MFEVVAMVKIEALEVLKPYQKFHSFSRHE